MYTTPRRPRLGFTLVELLVVIGIIALLVSILLPALGSARRNANNVKCMSNLKQIGMAFQLYMRDHGNRLPAVVHEPGNGIPIDVQRRWYDLIAKYVTSAKIQSYSDITKIRTGSVLWGCPEWSRIDFSSSSGDDLRPGYGMSFYTRNAFVRPSSSANFFREEWAYMSQANAAYGNYIRYDKWIGRNSAANVGLVADSMTHILQLPVGTISNPGAWTALIEVNSAFGGGQKNWQPGPASDPYTGGGAYFYVDGLRHAKSGAKKDSRAKYTNLLYMDWHVATVSVREVYTAISGRPVP